ncbi:MAG: hypothetical protein KatS3mg117_1347 [Geminicoccaceae bacterium]|jgi:hypothetical protein|nr:MAG: hypothetical protein KatS3mg117_1347 [Geminicoccaceae bacterium]
MLSIAVQVGAALTMQIVGAVTLSLDIFNGPTAEPFLGRATIRRD